MARAKKTPQQKPHTPPFVIRSLSLSEDTDATLKRLSSDASDYVGWTVSASAIVRALLRYADQQPTAWATSDLSPLIEREIASGIVWGKKK